MSNQSKKISAVKTIPFTGGMNTYNEPGMLPAGSYSYVQNMRQMRPGLKQRPGMIAQHSTADGTNRVMSMFQFSKGKRTERHFYAQMSDDDVLEATTNPPGVTVGAFGTEVFSGTTGSSPASWSVLNDKLMFSNGKDQHQICAGTEDYISKFIVYDSDTKLPTIPAIGNDYTDKVNDANTATVAVLDGLGNFVATSGTVTCTEAATDFSGVSTAFTTELTVGQPVYVDAAEKNFIATITNATTATVTTAWAAGHSTKTFTTSNDCVLICSPIMPNRLTWTISAANGNDSVACISYMTATGWKVLTVTDGTSSTGKTMAQTGATTWTQPTDAVPHYMFGTNGFWVKVAFSSALDAEVEVSSVTFGSSFVPMQDVWDGALADAIEAQFYDATYSSYYIFGSTSITVSAMTTSDYVYFNSYDDIVAAYIDVGGTPNTTSATTINAFQYLSFDGSWTSVGTFTDGTSGLSKSGFVTFNRIANQVPVQWNNVQYDSKWFRFTVDKTLSATVNIGIQVVPYYDISSYGVGVCNAAWKDRAALVFDQDPSYVYLSAPGNAQELSSDNSAIIQAGDGRANKVIAMRQFYNELLVVQEEKGASGGCITLIQGTKPSNLGKIVLSTKYGAMNANCLEIIETIEGGHNAFILSRAGLLVTEGRTVNFVPNFEKIRNYFDVTSTSCIRTGYEGRMYLKYDSSFHVLKIGLVSGSSATNNNVFLVYDILTHEFSVDSYQYPLSCECECDAASGNVPVVQLGGGQADGTVYVLNSGTNDVSTAVSSYVTIEFNNRGGILRDAEMIIRAKTQAAGNMTITPYYNGVIQSSLAKTLSLVANNANERMIRHRFPLNFKDQNISVKIAHNTASEGFYLLDYGIALEEYLEQ